MEYIREYKDLDEMNEKSNTPTNNHEKQAISNELQSAFDNYYTLKKQYESIKYFTYDMIPLSINHEYLKNELIWLYEHIHRISKNAKYNIIYSDEFHKNLVNAKYSQLLIFMRRLPRIYQKLYEYLDKPRDCNYLSELDYMILRNPDKIFNIYMHEYNDYLHDSNKIWKGYHKLYMFMFDFVIQFLDEAEEELACIYSVLFT